MLETICRGRYESREHNQSSAWLQNEKPTNTMLFDWKVPSQCEPPSFNTILILSWGVLWVLWSDDSPFCSKCTKLARAEAYFGVFQGRVSLVQYSFIRLCGPWQTVSSSSLQAVLLRCCLLSSPDRVCRQFVNMIYCVGPVIITPMMLREDGLVSASQTFTPHYVLMIWELSELSVLHPDDTLPAIVRPTVSPNIVVTTALTCCVSVQSCEPTHPYHNIASEKQR